MGTTFVYTVIPLLSHTSFLTLRKGARLAFVSRIQLCWKVCCKIHELAHCVESLFNDGNGFKIGLDWSRLVHHLSFLGADCDPSIVQELVKAMLISASEGVLLFIYFIQPS